MVWPCVLVQLGMKIDARSHVDVVEALVVDDNVHTVNDGRIPPAVYSDGTYGEVVAAGGLIGSDQEECCFDPVDDKMADNLDNS